MTLDQWLWEVKNKNTIHNFENNTERKLQMTIKKGIYSLLLISAFIMSCEPRNRPGKAYEAEIQEFRQEKNKFFKYNDNSPLPDSVQANFDSLNYFPIVPNYRIIADFLPLPARNIMQIPLNNGQSENYLKYGFATFTRDSVTCSVLILKSTNNDGSLFLPFYDQTNGAETYGGGRYLEPVRISESKIILDFNMAYHPYCVYADEYICPLPPKENILPIHIKAGEKLPEIP